MTTKSKGRKHEKEAMAVFREWGYGVWEPANSSRCIGPNKWISQAQDIAGCFDFMAWNTNNLHLVQVKTWDKGESHACEARKLIDAGKFPIWSVNLMVMARIPYKPKQFVIWHYDAEFEKWIRYKSLEEFG